MIPGVDSRGFLDGFIASDTQLIAAVLPTPVHLAVDEEVRCILGTANL